MEQKTATDFIKSDINILAATPSHILVFIAQVWSQTVTSAHFAIRQFRIFRPCILVFSFVTMIHDTVLDINVTPEPFTVGQPQAKIYCQESGITLLLHIPILHDHAIGQQQTSQ